MSTARREYFLLIGGLILLIITGSAVYYMQRAPNRSRDMSEITTVVTSFGGYEKSINVLASTTAPTDIQNNYGQFVTNALLQQWRADPAHAPGRVTSSPWPDHIEIDSITPQGSGYSVSGRVIEMTSTGASGATPVVMIMMRENDKWKIAAYQEAKTE